MTDRHATDTETKLRAYLERAMGDLKATRAALADRERRDSEPVAIISMACRLPEGLDTPEAFWEALVDGRDLMGSMPSDRGWNPSALFDPSGERPFSTYTTAGSFLQDVAGFDAEFFGISPREAAAMDPQQRLLLEVTWEAIERARIAPSALRGSDTGIFLGATTFDYGRMIHDFPADAEGNLYIRGRSKNMLLGASGQNIYPEEIEDKLNTLPFVMESIVIQKGEKLYALIHPDYDEVHKAALSDEELQKQMEANRRELNAMVNSYEQISGFRLYEEEFEKTPKRSIKRFLYADAEI